MRIRPLQLDEYHDRMFDRVVELDGEEVVQFEQVDERLEEAEQYE